MISDYLLKETASILCSIHAFLHLLAGSPMTTDYSLTKSCKTNQFLNQSINQSVSQSINKVIGQSVSSSVHPVFLPFILPSIHPSSHICRKSSSHSAFIHSFSSSAGPSLRLSSHRSIKISHL